MVVKVTDVNGNPITGKTVNWDLVSFSGGSEPSFDTVSITDSDGLAFARLYQSAGQGGSSGRPFLQSVIRATADNSIASFTETIALTDNKNGTLFFSATLDAPTGPLTGPAGGTGTSPIQIRVGNFVPFPGVSVRILSPEVTSAGGQVDLRPTLPSASCLTGQAPTRQRRSPMFPVLQPATLSSVRWPATALSVRWSAGWIPSNSISPSVRSH